jgi:hypothetical protein
VSAYVDVFSGLDLCYNTGHEAGVEFDPAFDSEFVWFHDCIEGG